MKVSLRWMEKSKTRFLASFFKKERKFNFNTITTATPDSAYQLLKKGAKLRKRRAQPKRYPASLHIISKNIEEDKESE